MALEAGWSDDPVRACQCPGLQAGLFLKKSCASLQPGFESSREAAPALSRGRKPMEKVGLRVEPRRRRQHLPTGASPKAVAKTPEGRACGRDARAPGGHDPSRQQIPHPPQFCKRLYCFRKFKRPCLCDRAIPSRSTSTPCWPFVFLRVSWWIALFLWLLPARVVSTRWACARSAGAIGTR